MSIAMLLIMLIHKKKIVTKLLFSYWQKKNTTMLCSSIFLKIQWCINSGRHAHTIIVFQNQVISLLKFICDSRLSASWERKISKFGILLVWLTYFHQDDSKVKSFPHWSLSASRERKDFKSSVYFFTVPMMKTSELNNKKKRVSFSLLANWESWIWNRIIHRKDLIREKDHR